MQQNDSFLLAGECAICGRQTKFWCSRCKNEWYCSTLHNRQDWQRHKLTCKPLNPGAPLHHEISLPPLVNNAEEIVSAIFFDVNNPRPTVIHVAFSFSNPTSRHAIPVPALISLFKEEPFESLVLLDGLNGEQLRFPLQIWYTPRVLREGAPINRAIEHITSGAASKAWAGPVVVLKFNGTRQKTYTNATMRDLPALSSYFLAYQ